MKTAVEKVKDLYLSGKKAQAYIRLGKMNNEHLLSKDDKKILVVAGESMNGNERFYKQLGYNIENVVSQAEVIFKKHFGI